MFIASALKTHDGYYRSMVLLFIILIGALGWRFVENGRFAVLNHDGMPYFLHDTRTGALWSGTSSGKWSLYTERER